MNTKVKWGGIDNTLIFKMQFSKEDAEEAREQYDQAEKLIKDINKGTAETVKLNKENLKIFTELLEKYEDLDLELEETRKRVIKLVQGGMDLKEALQFVDEFEKLNVEIQGTLDLVGELTKTAGEFAHHFSDAGRNNNIVAAGLESIGTKLKENAEKSTRSGKLSVRMYTSMVDKTEEILNNRENIATEEFRSVDLSKEIAFARREQDHATVAYLQGLQSINDEWSRQHEQVMAVAGTITDLFDSVDEFISTIPIIGTILSKVFDFSHIGKELSKEFSAGFQTAFGEGDKSKEAVGPKMEESKGGIIDSETGKPFVTEIPKEAAEEMSAMGSAGEMVGGVFGKLNKIAKSVMNTIMGWGPAVLGIVVAIGFATKLIFNFLKGMQDIHKETGLTYLESMKLHGAIKKVGMQYALLGVDAEDVKDGAIALIQEWGSVGMATEENIRSLARLSSNLGVLPADAAALAVQMKAVGSHSFDAAMSQMESVGALAQAAGVAPADVMADLAEDTDTFASFAQAGGKNLMDAAISARQLGVNLGVVTKAAEDLLEWETSIEKQFEAQMLTGKNINTDLARRLALEGNIEGLQAEILRQVGNEAEWNSYNVIQRKAVADAFGLSTSELAKMIANQDKLNKRAELLGLSAQEYEKLVKKVKKAWASIVDVVTDLWPFIVGIASPLIVVVTVLGAIVTGFGYIASLLEDVIGPSAKWFVGLLGAWVSWSLLFAGTLRVGPIKLLGQILTFGGNILKNLIARLSLNRQISAEHMKQSGLLGKMKKFFGFGGTSPTTPTTAPSKKPDVKPDGLTAMNPSQVLASAAAMLILAVAVAVLAAAFILFSEVTWQGVIYGILAMGALVLMASFVAGLGPVVLTGAVMMVILASAVLVLAIAMIGFAVAAQMFVPALEGLAKIGREGGLGDAALGILALGGALIGFGAMATAGGILSLVGAVFGGAQLLMFMKFAKLGPELKDVGTAMKDITKFFQIKDMASITSSFSDFIDELERMAEINPTAGILQMLSGASNFTVAPSLGPVEGAGGLSLDGIERINATTISTQQIDVQVEDNTGIGKLSTEIKELREMLEPMVVDTNRIRKNTYGLGE